MILTKPTGEGVWCALFGNLFHYAYMVKLCIIPDVTYCSSDSDSDTENEPVTSTVPELAREEIPPDIKSDRPSWLFRRSQTPSPRRRE